MLSRRFLVLSVKVSGLMLGLLNDDKVIASKTYRHSYKTENFLLDLDRFLSRCRQKASKLKGIVIVNAGGSFSQVRLIVTIANVLAYVGDFKIAQFPEPVQLPHLVKLLPKLKWHQQVKPKYGAPAVNKILS